MPGPPPNPGAIRRNARVGPISLPAEGRKGRTPRWPLPDNPRLTAAVTVEQNVIAELEEREIELGKLSSNDAARLTRARHRLAVAEAVLATVKTAETSLWRDLWKTPQACQWEKLGWTREVAQYVRWKAAAECGDLEAGKEARQYADRLGLNPKAMRALMWMITSDEVDEKRQEKQQQATSSRRRLRAVDTPAAEA